MNKKGNPSIEIRSVVRTIHPTRGMLFGALILGALLAFELFNYSTTDYALTDLMGNLRFLDLRWATILALAFCGIDFAGLARLFTPEGGKGESREVWYLFGAWLLAASMNAMLTWWGVAVAILSHSSQGSAVIPTATMLKVVPVFVAIMVWLIRVLIIGTFSVAGNRLFSQAESAYQLPQAIQPQTASPLAVPTATSPFHPSPRPETKPSSSALSRSEPTYQPASMSGSNPTGREVRK